jgi:hypothetical protein
MRYAARVLSSMMKSKPQKPLKRSRRTRQAAASAISSLRTSRTTVEVPCVLRVRRTWA